MNLMVSKRLLLLVLQRACEGTYATACLLLSPIEIKTSSKH